MMSPWSTGDCRVELDTICYNVAMAVAEHRDELGSGADGPSGIQTWLAGKYPTNGGFNGKISQKSLID